MADYNLGTAKGTIKTEYDGKGVDQAVKDQERFKKSADTSKEGIDKLGRGTAVAGGVVAAGFGLAAKVAIDFEKQISAIGAVSGASQDQLEALRKKALQLGADTVFSASDAASAMEELAKAGVPLEGILNGAADATVALAAAGGVELPAAAEIAADAMNSFSLSAQQMPHIADLIAGAANASSISVGDFGQSLKQVGAVANLVGLSFDDTATAIALMGQAGIKGSDAGTSLKTMLSNLQPVTKKQVELFRDLGILTKDNNNLFFDAKGNIKSLGDISQILQDKTKNMTAAQKQLTLETIFGSDAIRAAAVLTKAGAKGFDDMATAMGKVTAEEVAAKRLDNTAGQIEQLKGSAETAAIALGSLLLPALLKIAKGLTSFFNAINNLSPAMKNAVVIIGLVTGGILLLLATVVKIYQFVKALQAVVVAIRAIDIASKTAFLTNPIFLVVAAIVALVAAFIILWKRSEKFRNFWKGLWAGIKAVVMAVVDWFTGPFLNFFKRVWDGITAGVTFVLNFLKDHWRQIVPIFTGPFAPLVFLLLNFWDEIKAVFLAAINAIWVVVKPFWEVFQAIAEAAFAVVRALTITFVSVLKAIFIPIWNAIATVAKAAWDLITAVTKAAIDFIRPYVETFLKGLQIVWNAVWGAIKATATAVWNAIKAVITAVLNFLRPYIEATVKAIQTVTTVAWNVIKTVTTTVWNAIKATINTVMSAIKAIVQAAINFVVTTFNGVKQILEKVKAYFNGLRDAANGGTGQLIKYVTDIPRRILAAIGNLGKLLFNKGKELVQGFIDGIKSMFGAAGNAAKGLVDKVTGFLPGSPAKEGPLSGKGYVKLRGERMIEDFSAGIVNTANQARRAVSSLMADVSRAVPSDNAGAVGNASRTLSAVAAVPQTVANNNTNSRSVSIENVNINGTWDLANPDVPKQFVSKLHKALDDYEKEHR